MLEPVHHQTDKISTIEKSPIKEQDINKDNILPGMVMSEDHLISWVPDRLYHKMINSSLSQMFSGRPPPLTVVL